MKVLSSRHGFVASTFALLVAGIAGCSSPAPESGSCTVDAECKGDRVCEAGACVDPDAADDDGEGGNQGGNASGNGGGASEGGSGGGDVSTPGGPVFLSFGTDVTQIDGLYDGQSTVRFTAVLTDPDGVDDLIGGSLIDASGAPYGAFATSGQEGAYEMSLTWDQVNGVSPIDIDPGAASASRTFTAQFFDESGHVAEKTITLQLSCGSNGACDGECGRVRCGGQCTSLGSEENCTACGDDCGSGYCEYEEGTGGYYCWGAENTDALCSDGADNDGDGYTDCIDYNCSMSSNVTVCD
ncbi:MAG: hypothetical protein HOW73_48745 [Polyangiaceae bacterium]|nr:hypothetical protein [Polyangiaceae bacterium]